MRNSQTINVNCKTMRLQSAEADKEDRYEKRRNLKSASVRKNSIHYPN